MTETRYTLTPKNPKEAALIEEMVAHYCPDNPEQLGNIIIGMSHGVMTAALNDWPIIATKEGEAPIPFLPSGLPFKPRIVR